MAVLALVQDETLVVGDVIAGNQLLPAPLVGDEVPGRKPVPVALVTVHT
jgi:hypothetical protein